MFFIRLSSFLYYSLFGPNLAQNKNLLHPLWTSLLLYPILKDRRLWDSSENFLFVTKKIKDRIFYFFDSGQIAGSNKIAVVVKGARSLKLISYLRQVRPPWILSLCDQPFDIRYRDSFSICQGVSYLYPHYMPTRKTSMTLWNWTVLQLS